jgi:hypothetical protein
MASVQPLSEVAIANFAVTTLDESALTTLDDGSALGRFMSREFGFVRDELLRTFPWNFAKRRKLVPALASSPEFGYKYQYQMPEDCLRVLPLSCDGIHDNPPVKHEVEGRMILTDLAAPLKLKYVAKVTNASEFDPLFARALGQLLALMAAHRVTGKTAYVTKAEGLYREALFNAFHVNSLESGTPESQYRSSILDVRGVGL